MPPNAESSGAEVPPAPPPSKKVDPHNSNNLYAAHKRSTTATSSNSTLSIGTMSDDTTGENPQHPGTAIDDDSPRSTAVSVDMPGSSGGPTSKQPSENQNHQKAQQSGHSHKRSFSDEEMQRHLMTMQQQDQMMMAQQSQQQQQLQQQVPRRHSHSEGRKSRRHRGHRSHRSHGGGAIHAANNSNGNGGSGGKSSSTSKSSSSRKHRNRAHSADAEYYEQMYIQQQAQLAFQQQYAQAQAQYYGRQIPPYRPANINTSSGAGGMPPKSPRMSPPGRGMGLGAPPMTTPPAALGTTPPSDFVTPPSKSSRRKDGRTRLQKSTSAPAGANMFGSPGAPPVGYGSMDQYTKGGSPGGGGGGGGPITPSANFSARRELLALAGQSPSYRPPVSPSGNMYYGSPGAAAASAGLSPGGMPIMTGQRGRTNSWGGPDMGSSPMTHLSPLRESRAMTEEDFQHQLQQLQAHHAAINAPPLSPAPPAYTSPGAPMMSPGQSGGMGVYEAPPGETDAFLPQHFGHHHSGHRSGRHSHKRSASTHRKMHMRQESVELFMDNVKGVEQTRRCRDILFALLFCAQVAAIAYIGIRYSRDALHGVGINDMRTEDHITTYRNFITVGCLSGAFAVATSALALLIMMAISRRLVQVALIFSIGMAFAWGTIGIGLSPRSFVPVTGIVALALSIGYFFVVYDRIPFATANLRTALCGIRVNLGLVGVTFCFQAIALAVSIYYAFAGIGLYDAILFGDLNLSGWTKVLAFVGVGLAYYWTYQVLCHVVQVTVAGVIGSWWFKPETEATSPCSKELMFSFQRSTVLSFGSICFGSLLVGFVQILRQFVEPMRPNRDETVLMCLHECLVCFQECLVSCIDGLAESFNPWAFTYVGLYGYGFLEAGHHATELFRRRGWSMIVTDDLIPNVLFILSLVIGGVTGLFAVLVEVLENFQFVAMPESSSSLVAFLAGLVIGLIVSSVLFGLISSAVNAVIVCFAGSPVEFDRNHHELSHEMRNSWREVWPGCMDVHDMKISAMEGVSRLNF